MVLVNQFKTIKKHTHKMSVSNLWPLTMEFVGDTELVIELFTVVDVVVRLLFVMEVKIAWVSSALETLLLLLVSDVSNCDWSCDVLPILLLNMILFWMLLCRTAPFSALDCCETNSINTNAKCDTRMVATCCCDGFITDDA